MADAMIRYAVQHPELSDELYVSLCLFHLQPRDNRDVKALVERSANISNAMDIVMATSIINPRVQVHLDYGHTCNMCQ